jgi:hypothetical protein
MLIWEATKEQKIETATIILKQIRDARQALYDSDLGEEHQALEANVDDGLYSAEGYMQTLKSRLEGNDD